MTILVITAVELERDAIVRDLGSTSPVDVGGVAGLAVDTGAGPLHAFHSGVGPVAAGVTTAYLLAIGPGYNFVISAGIAGGFRGRAEVGDVVLADRVIAADQGVLTDDGFRSLRELELPGVGEYTTASSQVHRRLEGGAFPSHCGDLLTLSCMTGTVARAEELATRYPHAVAEAMEGYGVIEAVQRHGARAGRTIPFAEIRAISNLIGRRDRSTWNIPLALDALGQAMSTVLKEPLQ